MAAPRCWRLGLRSRGLSVHTAAVEVEVEATAAPAARYPPVVASLTAKSKAARQRRIERWQAAAHAAGSVDEKLRILTKIQFPKYVVYPQTFARHADRWYQAFTKTAFVAGLPGPSTPDPAIPGPSTPDPAIPGPSTPDLAIPGPAIPDPAPPDLAALRTAVTHLLLQEHLHLQRPRRAPLYQNLEVVVSPFLDQLVATLVGLLGPHNPALPTAVLDYKRPVHFYWIRGEEIIPRGHRKGRVDALRYQIDDRPHNQIRLSKQLPEFVPLDYSVPVDIPVMNCKPDKLPLFKRQYENIIFTGSKTADPCCYGHTQFHLLPDKLKRERLLRQNCADQIEVVYRANAIASLFAWTGAQAMYQGFWSEADVTRPFVSQAVITDGKYFSFFCYQLNTLALTEQADKNNPRQNLCWGTHSQPLYESIEGGEVKGFNDAVLLQLVQLLLSRPREERAQPPGH